MNLSPILALAGLITIGLLVPRLTSIKWPRVPSLDLLVGSGGALVALGLVLGPGIDFVNQSTIGTLAPAIALAIGWIGATFGSRFEWRVVRRIPRAAWLQAAIASAVTMTAVALVAWVATRVVPALASAWTPRLPAILTLGALGAAAGPGVMALVLRTLRVEGRAARTALRAATLETLCALFAMSVPFALHRRGNALIAWLAWVAAAGMSGALVGSLFLWLTRRQAQLTRAELEFALLASLLCGAGIGSLTGTTPFVVCFLASVVIVTVSPRRRAVRNVLAAAERPMSAVLFVAAGALLAVPTGWILLAVLVLGGVRAAAKWAAVRHAPPNVGLETLAQGGVAVALGLSYGLLYGTGAVLATIVLLVAVSVLSTPSLLPFAPRPASAAPALTRNTAQAELSATISVEVPQ